MRETLTGRNSLQFSFQETGSLPLLRTYEDYLHSAEIAIRTGDPHDGVKGLWCLHILDYAGYIRRTVDFMHTAHNVICDILGCIRPTNGGDRKLFQHKNRTVDSVVLKACADEGIHSALRGGDNNYIFSKAECIAADECMNRVIGCHDSGELPKGVLKRGKAKNSHDTILWAITWARWCLRDKGSDTYMPCVFDLFESLSSLNSSLITVDEGTDRDEMHWNLLRSIIKLSGLVPPSESTMTIHELIHIHQQIFDQGAPRFSTLFKFERMNLFLKVLLKNNAAGNLLYLYRYAPICADMHTKRHICRIICYRLSIHHEELLLT